MGDMKKRERPILFSGPMVTAILAGTKTMTRRVWKDDRWPCVDRAYAATHPGAVSHLCPYGIPGDRLWIRETFALSVPGCERGVSYRADHRDPRGDGPAHPMKWRPSIHMPRWASRLTLEVTAVRVERLHDISEADILAEGVTVPLAAKMTGIPWSSLPTLHDAWREGWKHINGAASWDANPWVWVVGFKTAKESP